MKTTIEAPPPTPPPAPVVDPNLALQQQRAQTADITALQQQSQADTAALMARYGSRLAIANVVK